MKKIKNKTELLNAKLREFKIKEQALKDCVPLEIHNKVKKQLQDLLKRHQDFRNVLVFNQPNNGSVVGRPQQQINVMPIATNYNSNLTDEIDQMVVQNFTKEMFPVISLRHRFLCFFKFDLIINRVKWNSMKSEIVLIH